MASSGALEVQAVIILVCYQLGYSRTLTCIDIIQHTSSGHALSRTQVFEWH